MRQSYPDYKKRGVNNIEDKLTSHEKKILNDFLKYRGITAGVSKLKDNRISLLQVRDVMQVPFDKITLQDIRNFLSVLNQSDRRDWTKRGIKQALKTFLKWKYPDWSKRFNVLQDIKLGNPKTEDKINKSTLLTEQEIELMVKKCDSWRDKAYIMVLFETGARPQEIRNLKWKDVKFKEDFSEITLYSGKTTSARTLPIKDSANYLKRWKESYPFPDVTNHDYIFPSVSAKDNPISPQLTWHILKEISKRAGINKPIYNYIFRHSRLNMLYKKLPIQIHRKYAGHSKDSNMSRIYEHLDNEDLMKIAIDNIYKSEELPPEKKLEFEKEIENLKKERVKDKMDVEALKKSVDGFIKKIQSAGISV